MANIFSDLRNNHESVQRILLFLLAAVLLVLLLPKEGQFKYEYQKGKPWLHEDLVAPFDFALEKQAGEIDNEIAEIRSNAQVYLTMDITAEDKAKAKLKSLFIQGLEADTSKPRGKVASSKVFRSWRCRTSSDLF